MKKILNSAKFFLTLVLFLGHGILWAKLIIVSDIDDTIKKTNVSCKFCMVYNTIRGAKDYPILLTIYHDLIWQAEFNGENHEVLYLSASPNFVNVSSWLKKYDAPKGRIIQRTVGQLIRLNTLAYKFQTLKRYLLEEWEKEKNLERQRHAAYEKRPLLTVYLFGDNGEKDAEVYSLIIQDPDIKKLSPRLVITSFIRMVVPEENPLLENIYFSDEEFLLNHFKLNFNSVAESSELE
jgi:phosphatidate phosphatase APP1